MTSSLSIYALTLDVDNACGYFLDDRHTSYAHYYDNYFVGVPLPKGWTLPRHCIGDERKPLRDFIAGDEQAPYVSARAAFILGPMLAKDAEFVPIGKIRGQGYTVMNVLRSLGYLDWAKSVIQFSSEDPHRITNIWKYAFIQKMVPQDVKAFKVAQDHSRIFVTRRFVDCVLEHRLSGVTFEDPMNLGVSRILNVIPGLPVRASER